MQQSENIKYDRFGNTVTVGVYPFHFTQTFRGTPEESLLFKNVIQGVESDLNPVVKKLEQLRNLAEEDKRPDRVIIRKVIDSGKYEIYIEPKENVTYPKAGFIKKRHGELSHVSGKTLSASLRKYLTLF